VAKKPAGKVDMKQAINRAKELRQQASKLMAQGEALMGGGRRDGAIAKTTRAGLKLGKNADGKFAWFSRDGKQRTGAYKTKGEAQKSPEIEGKEQAARFKVRAKSSAKAKMDQKDYQNADSKWGKLSDSQIEKMIQRDTAAARSLQNNREFTGNNTRRYGFAMANQGAVEAFESARQAGRYLSERRVRKPRRKP
jgi:hypothetical protein